MTAVEFTKARAKLKLSLREMGKTLGIHHMTVWKYEQGKLPIPVAMSVFTRVLVAMTTRKCKWCAPRKKDYKEAKPNGTPSRT